MKKCLLVLLVLLLASTTFLFAGGADESTKAEGGEIILKIPSYKTGENVGATFFEPQVERFNAQYAGKYRIELESVPEASFKDKMKQLAQQKKLPVLVQGGDFEWFENVVVPNGLAWDMSAWLDETPSVKSVLLDDSLEYCTETDGAIYSLPLATIRPIGFYYNADMYSPSADVNKMTMEQWIDDIKDEKIAFSTAENGWVSALILTALIANEEGGAEFLKNGVENKIVDFNNPIMINAVAKLQKLLQNNASVNSIGAAYPDAANAFMSKQASIISNGSWMSSDFAPSNSKNWSNGFDGASVHASLFAGNIGIANGATYGEWWISADASELELEAAKAFLEFVYSPSELEAYLLSEGGSAPKLKYSDAFLEKQAETKVLAELAQDADAETKFVPAILDVIPASVANVEFGKLLPSLADGSYTPEEFCQWLTTKAVEATE